mmetsp:Transcript_86843/g.246275  ORF Transcript_86843/g.246275 Transcript_86843/m.246275 type:complete len:119 (-) Transcript_86843:104-460(-)|eukprot:CAMPEP_0179315588 /NCGR_PEP_ID=MMETSP0797-20121207/55154_1 /TAXON_ID=47934 /ORGANISM="Dinophysis acuminata, Strain DAEP01" /LENGTH=118 /DNA_ID=CAMNT_0021026147 /DNA_START=42 /DNA_END=398 /DNA_ORIENTATION=-
MAGTSSQDPNVMAMQGYLKVEWDRFAVYDSVETVEVDINGVPEVVRIDRETGPQVLQWDGSLRPTQHRFEIVGAGQARQAGGEASSKGWLDMTTTEQKVIVHIVAKKNRKLKERFGYA